MIPQNKEIILHIDDDEANRYAVKRILEKSGFEVIEAALGNEGLAMARQHQPDLIVLDIKLPDIDGFEVCRKLKADKDLNPIPVLQTSASFVSSEHKVTGLDSGADGYLAQPIEAAVLVATVKSLLRIRRAEKIATDAMRAREEVLAIVTHDLRNPLSFIMLQARLMENGLVDGSLKVEDVVHRFKKINKSCHKMNHLIQDLLDVTSLEKGNFNLVKRPFVVSTLLNDIVTFYEEIALQSEITLLVDAQGHANKEIIADKDRLQQVIGNLIQNSLKFTPSGGKVTLKVSHDGSNIVFCIIDTGNGISEKDLPNVFNRYWQGHAQRKNGYGIGLSIVKGITEAHGGSVTIESKEFIGTTVIVKIPEK